MIRRLLLLHLWSALALASPEDTTRVYLLGEVVVTGRAEAVVLASSVTEVERGGIALRDAPAVSGSIAFLPGTYIHTNARNEAVPTLRGFEPRQVATFLDGVPLALPYDGVIDLDQLAVAYVAKITVTRGMPSILYGPNSMGGTINVVSSEPGTALAGQARLEGGWRRTGLVSLGSSLGPIGWFVSGQYGKADDFPLPHSVPEALAADGRSRDNSASQGYSLFAKLGAGTAETGRLTLSLLHSDNPKNIPTNIYTARPRYWRYTEWRKTVLTLAGEASPAEAVAVKGTLFYETYDNVLNSYDDATFSTQRARYAFQSTYDDHSLGGTLVTGIVSPLEAPLKLLASARRDVHREQPTATSAFTRFAAETYSFGVEQEGRFGRLSAVAGLGLDILRPTDAGGGELRGSARAWAAHAGVVWSASPQINLHAHAGHRSRFPTLKELYSENLGRNIPNRELTAERAWNYEAGVTWMPGPQNELRLALYYSDVRGLIQNVFVTPDTRQQQNLGKALLAGTELSARALLAGHAIEAAYTFLLAENRSANASSVRLEHRPRHSVTLAADVALPLGASLRAEGTFTGSRYSVDLDDGSWEELDGYWLFNLRLGVGLLDGLELFGRIDNLTDTYYESEYGIPQAGRAVVGGIRASW